MLSFFRSRRPLCKTNPQPKRPAVEALEERCTPAACHVVSGFVYQDANNNGIFDPGETPIANSPIQLRNAAGMIVGSTTTNAQGFYKFEHDATLSTAPSSITKTVSFQSTSTDFSLNGLLDQFDPALGQLQEIEITHEGSITSSIKVENFSNSSSSTISGTVSGYLTLVGPGINHKLTLAQNAGSFNAPIFDGTIDFGGTSGTSFGATPAASSGKITLTGNDLNPYIGTGKVQLTESAVATSSASGGGNIIAQITSTGAATISVVYKYIPNNCLKPGNYTIIQTQQPAGLLDGKDSKGGVPLANSIGTDAIDVVLGSSDLTNNNFGEIPPPQLSGYVYHDVNNNGIKDAGEAGIPGVVINLTGTDDLGAVSRSLTTDSNGFYQFLNLRPGTYSVAEIQPSGWLDGLDKVGTTGGTTANDVLSGISLPPGIASLNNNFGELKPASVSGYVYVDANNNGVKDPGETGISGVTVTLGGAATATATTNASGFYQFTGLLPGTYHVQQTQPSGYLDGKDVVGTLGGTLNNDLLSSISLQSDSQAIDYNFGELAPASLSGYVYADANNNGVKEAGEAAISGVLITLSGFNDLGPVSLTATTDSSGFYRFQNLRPGVYTLVESHPAGFLDGKDTIGTQGGTTGNDQLTSIPLGHGVNGLDNNFGELVPAGLSGFVYVDANENGVKDAGEEGIAGVTVTLTGSNDVGAVSIAATTDANGFYRFQNLRPGVYTITETQPAGYKDGIDAIGSQGGVPGNDVFSSIALAAGVLGMDNNFGEIRPELSDLRIVKTVSLPVVRVGQQLTYTLTISNLGEHTAKGVVVIDKLPTDAVFVGGAGVGWNVTHTGGVVTATRTALATGLPSTITITIVAPAVSNQLVNEATVTSDTPDPNPNNNKSTVTTTVVVDPKPIPPLVTKLSTPPTTSKRQLLTVGGSVSTANKQRLAFLDGLYQTLLGRSPTRGELNTQYQRMLRGTSREVIVRELWNSDEHFALMTKQLYNSYLHRLPNALESAMMVQQLRSGVDASVLIQQLVTSVEYQGQFGTPNKLVGGLYLDLTGKLPDAASHQGLVLALNNQPLSQAVQGIVSSQDALRFSVDTIYRTVLYRAATASEMQFGALQLQTGVSQAEMSIKILSSNNFYQLAWRSVKR